MADYLGQQLGKYRLTQLLGTGGFAEVYLGEHIHLGTEAAIKLLHTQLATEAEVEKFRQEARTIGKLTHPNIVRVLDFDVQDGTPYLVMDYAPNGSLRQRIPTGQPLAPADILPYLTQVASALQYAHDQKLVHRDIKPENMLLGRRNEVLLSDFGIATVAQSTTSQKTEGVAGTAAYMAPEQIQGKPRPASDLYSLGVIVYEWLAGERTFQGTFTEVASQHLFALPPPLRDKLPGLSPLIEQVVLTALAKDPKERFGSVQAFANAFIQASGAAGTIATFVPRMIPPAPGADPAGMSLSSAATRQGAQPNGPSIYGATTHITPQLTPQFSAATPYGGSVFDAPTRFTPPTSATAPVNPVAGYVAPPMEGQAGYMPSANMTPPAQNIPPMQGWAAQIGSMPSPGPLATFETGASTGGPIVPSPEAGKGPRKRGVRLWLLGVAAALLLLMLIGGSVLAYSRLVVPATASTGRNGPTAPTGSIGATVTITPRSSALQKSYTITAVSGTPDGSQNQIGEQQISVTTQAYSSTVNATGTTYVGGSSAQGKADIYNFDTTKPLNLAAGRSFPNDGGCAPSSETIVLDAAVTNLAAGAGPITVPIHIQPKGVVKGNPAGCVPLIEYITGNCSGSPCTEIAVNITTNGTDPQPQTVVQQSDIDNVAATLEQNNQPNADQEIQSQLQSGQQEIAGTAQCSPNVNANHAAGDQASQVTVTVTFTCTAEVFTAKDATDLAGQLLKNDAQSQLGAQYAPVGQIAGTIVSSSPGDQGAENLVVGASGTWVYQFSATEQQNLAALIVGKTTQQARQTLLAQPGVADAVIQITSGNGQTLPTKAQEIMVKIKTGAGAS